ncbi:MAG: methyl-accepting chemotaxis protein [Candidatus Limnocylindrales bacterium]|jgi:methyl-accepting chemotaxis protein
MGRSIRFKLMAVFAFVFVGMAIATALVVIVTGSVRTDIAATRTASLPAVQTAGDVHLAVVEYRNAQLAFVNAADAAAATDASSEMAQAASEAEAGFEGLAKLSMPARARAQCVAAKAAWTDYLSATASGAGPGVDASTSRGALQSGSATTTFESLDAALDALQAEVVAAADAASSNAGDVLNVVLLVDVGGCLALVAVGSLTAFLVIRGLLRRVRLVSETLDSLGDNCVASLEAGLAALAANDLTLRAQAGTQPIEGCGRDEIGLMAQAANAVLAKLHATLGSYEKARVNLASALSEVHSAAQAVSRTASEVNGAAVQSGHGSQQIAQTIGQVAAGAADQAHASTETSGAVADLRTVIEQVRRGAAETARSVEAQAAAVDQMTRSIRSASRASSDVHNLGGAVGEAAGNGAATVRQTVDGMARIKSAVEGAAGKVTELGAKSDQIGAIVETIDDIAEQTNLLALNAAIEAARAGEQGKGFAVVADEVRKLAERSSRATKEIADLIAEVQTETEAAVKAMKVGAVEVEAGAELAGRSGAALDEIAGAVESSNAAVARIVEAMEKMQNASAGLVTASDAIAAIAEQTNAAAESMSGSAEQVGSAVESIAAISEEVSASAEEVSAATEQLSGQAEEVVASAATMADMAASLETLAARFRLDRNAGILVASVVDAHTDGVEPSVGQRPRRAA